MCDKLTASPPQTFADNESVDTFSLSLVLLSLAVGAIDHVQAWAMQRLDSFSYVEGARPPIPDSLKVSSPDLVDLIEKMWLADFRARPAMKDVVVGLEASTDLTGKEDGDETDAEMSTAAANEATGVSSKSLLQVEEVPAKSLLRVQVDATPSEVCLQSRRRLLREWLEAVGFGGGQHPSFVAVAADKADALLAAPRYDPTTLPRSMMVVRLATFLAFFSSLDQVLFGSSAHRHFSTQVALQDHSLYLFRQACRERVVDLLKNTPLVVVVEVDGNGEPKLMDTFGIWGGQNARFLRVPISSAALGTPNAGHAITRAVMPVLHNTHLPARA